VMFDNRSLLVPLQLPDGLQLPESFSAESSLQLPESFTVESSLELSGSSSRRGREPGTFHIGLSLQLPERYHPKPTRKFGGPLTPRRESLSHTIR